MHWRSLLALQGYCNFSSCRLPSQAVNGFLFRGRRDPAVLHGGKSVLGAKRLVLSVDVSYICIYWFWLLRVTDPAALFSFLLRSRNPFVPVGATYTIYRVPYVASRFPGTPCGIRTRNTNILSVLSLPLD
jgi:hypothetical protein